MKNSAIRQLKSNTVKMGDTSSKLVWIIIDNSVSKGITDLRALVTIKGQDSFYTDVTDGIFAFDLTQSPLSSLKPGDYEFEIQVSGAIYPKEDAATFTINKAIGTNGKPTISSTVPIVMFEVPDLSQYAEKSELTDYAKKSDLPDSINLAEYAKKSDLPDLSSFAKKTDIQIQQDLSDYAKKSDIPAQPDLSGYAKKSDIPAGQDLSQYAKKTDIPVQQDLSTYAKKSDIPAQQDLTPYATKVWVQDGYATKDSLFDYAKKSDIPAQQDLTPYAKKTDIPTVPNMDKVASVDQVNNAVAGLTTATIVQTAESANPLDLKALFLHPDWFASWFGPNKWWSYTGDKMVTGSRWGDMRDVIVHVVFVGWYVDLTITPKADAKYQPFTERHILGPTWGSIDNSFQWEVANSNGNNTTGTGTGTASTTLPAPTTPEFDLKLPELFAHPDWNTWLGPNQWWDFSNGKYVRGTKWGDLTDVLVHVVFDAQHIFISVQPKATDYYAGFTERKIVGKQYAETANIFQWEVANDAEVGGRTRLPQLTFYGDISAASKEKYTPIEFDIVDERNNTLSKGYASIKWQGDSSLAWEKKNYKIKFYSDSDRKVPMAVTINNQTLPQTEIVVKANFIDATNSRNNVFQRLNRKIMQSRDSLPIQQVKGLNFSASDGYPFVLNIDSLPTKFNGIYTWQYSDMNSLYSIDSKDDKIIAFAGANGGVGGNQYYSSFTTDTIDKPDGTNGWELNTKPWDDTIAAAINEMSRAINSYNDTDYVNWMREHMDMTSLYDYICFRMVIGDVDAWRKNMGFITWDKGSKWHLYNYDMDNTLGLDWQGNVDQISKVGNVPNYLNNRLVKRTFDMFGAELVSRYKVLRRGVLSSENIANEFREYISIIPKYEQQRELSRWSWGRDIDHANLDYIQSAVYQQAAAFDRYLEVFGYKGTDYA